MKKDAPIGVFDSGIGGMTVAHAIQELLPHESILYFGDTAHLPYGDKSPESIRHYAARIANFLIARECKMIVIACNTASAHASKIVRDICGPKIPVVDVIDPVALYVSKHYKGKNVGIIGTKGTISSKIYSKKIKLYEPEIKVSSKATPLLASLIEEGFFDNSISRSVISNYLESQTLKGIDALVLGCTHYPLIRKEVEEFYNHQVEIIDSGSLVAAEVHQALKDNKGLANGMASHTFYVSDKTASFEKSTRIFFGERIRLSEARIWD